MCTTFPFRISTSQVQPNSQEKKEEPKIVNLRVRGEGYDHVNFQLKKATPLKLLKEAYCAKAGVRSDE